MKQEMKNLGDFPGVVENLSCCFYITQAEEPYELLYANEEMLRLFDCRDFDELYRHVDGDAFHVIAMDDRARVKQEIVHELAERNDRFDHARGHLFTRTSRIRYADVSGRIVETQAHGKVCYCTLQEIDIPLPGVTVDRDIRDYVISHLDEAIENHWIQVYYQPVIRTLTGELCGMEALARWVDPQIGFLSPASFIPVLEQVRLIHQLDAYVLEEVCHMLRQRLNHDLPITPVSFNLSRYDFDMVDVFHLVEKTRAAYQIPRDALHVEITESALAENDDAVHRAVDRLRDEGYEIWLDDFGSGYSSLNILKDYTVDLIKLDMGFLRSFTEKSRDIIRSVIDMAKELGIKTLAEGVETQEHAEFLASIGCGRQQGYYTASRSRSWERSHISRQRGGRSSCASGATITMSQAWPSARRTRRVHSSTCMRTDISTTSTPTGFTGNSSMHSAIAAGMSRDFSIIRHVPRSLPRSDTMSAARSSPAHRSRSVTLTAGTTSASACASSAR